MSKENIPERIDYLENSLRELIVRVYTIEQKLGLRLAPAEQPIVPSPEEGTNEAKMPVPDWVQAEVEKAGGTVVELEPKKPLPPPAHRPPTIKELVEQEWKSQVDIVSIPAAGDKAEKAIPLPRPEPVETIVQPLVSTRKAAGRSLETIIGGTMFNRIGIVAIILAVGLFLQYAFKERWIGPAGRVVIGVVIGIGLVVLGERIIARGYRSYAQGISGGGIAILYLAFFAAFALYHLTRDISLDQTLGFLFMSAVTALAVLLAARHDALTIAILGLIGGFLTPIMLSTGSDNQAGLFTYIALLDVGVLALAYFKQWRVLNYLAFGATILMAAGWYAKWYDPDKVGLTIFFFTLFFLIFAALAILHNVVNRRPTRSLDLGLILANASIYFSTSYQLLDEDYYGYLGLFAILMAAFYLGLGYLTYSRDREDRLLILTFLGLATIFLTLAIPIQLDQNWVTMAWAIQGAVFTWIGFKANNRVTRYSALIVFSISLWHWFSIDFGEFAFGRGETFIPIVNRRGFSALVLIASLAIAGRLYRRYGQNIDGLEKEGFGAACMLASNILALFWLSTDLVDYFNQKIYLADDSGATIKSQLANSRLFAISVLWIIYGAISLVIGIIRNSRLLRYGAFGLLALATMKVLALDAVYHTERWHTPIFNQTFIAFAMLAGAFALGVWFYKRNEKIDKEERAFAIAVLVGIANLMAIIGLSLEVRGYFKARQGGPDWRALEENKQFLLTALWTVYGAIAVVIGIIRNSRLLRYGSLVLLALATMKVLALDAGYHTEKLHTPIFNRTFIAFAMLAGAFAIGVWFYKRNKKIDEKERTFAIAGLVGIANLMAIIGLSLEVRGYFKARQEDDGDWRALEESKQFLLTALWTVYGAIALVIGIIRNSRLLRYGSLALLALATMKVLALDAGYHTEKLHTPIFNQTFIAFAMLAGAFALGVWFYKRNEKIDEKERAFAIAGLVGIANLMAIIGLSLEVRGYFRARQEDDGDWRAMEESKQFLLTALWTVYGTAALAIGLIRRAKIIRYGALGLLMLAIIKVLTIDIFFAPERDHLPIFNKTFGAFIILVAALGFSLWLYLRSDGVDKKEHTILRNGLTIALNLLAIIGLSAEAFGFFESRILGFGLSPDESRELQLAQYLSLSIIWAIYGGAMLLYGIWHENRLLRRMALGLLSLTIVKVFFIDISGLDRIYRIAAFFILGAILLVVSFKYQQWQRREVEERR